MNPPSHPPTQGEIAKAAGVSASTVSRALNNHPGIPVETREHVKEIAARMGYRRNPLVSVLTAQLRKKKLLSRKATLGYVTSLPHTRLKEVNPTYLDFYLGAKARAEDLGYSLDLLWRKEGNMTGKRFTQILSSRGIKGLIFAPRPRALSHFTLDWNRFASATIGHHFPRPRIHLAGSWHYAIIDQALRMLRKYHYERVGYCVWGASDEYARFSFSSRYLAFSQEQPTRKRIPLFNSYSHLAECAKEEFSAWFFKYRPEVLLTTGPVILEWLAEWGVNVPGEVAVVDLCLPDDSGNVAGMWEMPAVIGAAAVDLVVEQLNYNDFGIPANPRSLLFEGKWIDGATLPIRKAASS